MSFKHIIPLAACAAFLISCGSKEEADRDAKANPDIGQIVEGQPKVHGTEVKSVELTNPLKQEWVNQGKQVYEMKCLACHKLGPERVVGPGWEGVTKRREPEWIMNMILNVDMMLETDEEAQKLLELCLVRMPNQNLTYDEARASLEFMRANDGEQ